MEWIDFVLTVQDRYNHVHKPDIEKRSFPRRPIPDLDQ